MRGRRRGVPAGRNARQNRLRARRFEQRLENVKRARAKRTHTPLRDRSPQKNQRTGVCRALLFVFPLLAGTLLASTAVEGVRAWWSGGPADVESIAVLGNAELSAADVAAATGLSQGEPLRGLSEAEIEARVARHPWIRGVRAALLPTGTIVVAVEERVARAVLRTRAPTGQEELYLVDTACAPFVRVEPVDAERFQALPRIAARSGELPDAEDPTLCAAVSLAESVHGSPTAEWDLANFEVVLPDAGSHEGFRLREPARHEVLLGHGTAAEFDDRLDRLGRLLAARPAQLERASTIDLRFADQAVLRSLGASR